MNWLGITLVAVIFGQDVFKEITQDIIELNSCDHSDNFQSADPGRIAGNARTRAPPHSWPWIVRLDFITPGGGSSSCGGTIIGQDLILTGKDIFSKKLSVCGFYYFWLKIVVKPQIIPELYS